ncbi:hypothetical protein [uncultured Odoribacter sp.]|nr:hypothetical protein [uncultured Odoribacter sp.]
MHENEREEADRKNLDVLFANIEYPAQAMEFAGDNIISGQGDFANKTLV